MAKTFTLVDKVSLRQKGWKLFTIVLLLQIIFIAAAYLMR